MKITITILSVLVAFCSIGAGGLLFLGLSEAQGAPQEAAVAAVCLCIAVIPYVFLRALEIINNQQKDGT